MISLRVETKAKQNQWTSKIKRNKTQIKEQISGYQRERGLGVSEMGESVQRYGDRWQLRLWWWSLCNVYRCCTPETYIIIILKSVILCNLSCLPSYLKVLQSPFQVYFSLLAVSPPSPSPIFLLCQNTQNIKFTT